MKTMFRSLAVGALTLCLASSAWAQDNNDDAVIAGYNSSSTSTTTSTGIAITVGPILTTTMVAGSDGSNAKMEQYMRQNATALQQDINMGGGQAVADLAQMFQVDAAQHQAFGKMLRQHRGELLGLTNTDALNHERAGQFISAIIGAMKQDNRFHDSVNKLQG